MTQIMNGTKQKIVVVLVTNPTRKAFAWNLNGNGMKSKGFGNVVVVEKSNE